MKDARGGTHSLAEFAVPLPARQRLPELNGHSPRRFLPLLINASDRHAVVVSRSHGGRLG